MMEDERKERYINPYTDFGFKKLFGTEMNKDLLISFLNALFMGHQHIKDISYLPTEHFGLYGGNRRAIFDVYCEDENGGKFIVEMQNVSQQYYKDRSVFYSTFPIQEQAKVGGDWDFNLKEVYTVGILNFEFRDEDYSKDCYHHEVKLMDTQTKKVFYDKLTMIYLEMPKFNKTEDQLETMFDKWLFVLRNLSRLFERPKALQEKIFTKLFEQVEIARFTLEERRGYEDSVKTYRDINNAIRTAKKEAKEEGIKEGHRETARRMITDGMDKDLVAKYTGLSLKEIEEL
ncbi:MAG: PD-(D/E)XK nuclease family transposase [Prevotella sp.]|nr:PD-(D/E)XK nuclease family transposase [Prevotella sp.]